MKYFCTLISNDESDVVVLVNNIKLNCFSNIGLAHKIGDKFFAEIVVYDDFDVFLSNSTNKEIRQLKGYEYLITGVLDIDRGGVDSLFFLELDELYDYGYLDKKMVDVRVVRLDIIE
ncbi:hypothetical protein BKK52_02615 [Rodentibacter trehalosifermentans]|uniref:Uncharacterized protein n=1 Tax=Rodentibacter trehalosifermentans TaxID=1908263 RepID=A0A1V3J4S0_9PAST|nr:hypothetical protein [Rodentibacter trehalosifermentans]OOF49819.1 hypothetical protein BKK52_02615 [Rodentibacter trehalosifermentans]